MRDAYTAGSYVYIIIYADDMFVHNTVREWPAGGTPCTVQDMRACACSDRDRDRRRRKRERRRQAEAEGRRLGAESRVHRADADRDADRDTDRDTDTDTETARHAGEAATASTAT